MRPVVFLLLLAPSLSAGEKPATIRGAVRFVGDVPPDRKILTTDGATILHNDLVVDAKAKGLRYVAVYLEKAPAHKVAAKKAMVLCDQRDMLFHPRIVAVQEGQTVRFENNDLCNHCVRGSALETANTFNAVTPPGQPFDFRFKAHKHPTVIDCPIHAWMKAYVFTFDHPFFAVTDEKGAYAIKDVPPGKHTLVFRHMDTGTMERRPLDVRAGSVHEESVEWRKTGTAK
ncbi:MAG: hypothetical protein U0793_09885 [Gemmataceae bacterium]